MKNKKLFVGLIGLIILFIPIFFTVVNGIEATELKNNSNLRLSTGVSQGNIGIYDLSAIIEIPYTISIDNNWTETVLKYKWATGSGTEEDPYIIQNVKINANDTRYAIKINKGSNFIIRNNIFTNTTNQGEKTAGIYIIEAEDGLIEYNNFTYCKTGFFSVKAKKMTFSYNSLLGDFNGTSGNGRGFWAYEGEELIISNNFIYNYYGAIGIWDAAKNEITNNTIINYEFGQVVEAGIKLNNVNDSSIIGNDLYGVYSEFQFSSIQTSNIDYNPINLENCYNITIHNNRFYDLDGNLLFGSEEPTIVTPNYWIFILIGLGSFIGISMFLYFFKKYKKNKLK